MATNSSMAEFIKGLEKDIESAQRVVEARSETLDITTIQLQEARARLDALQVQLGKARKAGERKKPTREPQAAPRSMPMRNGPVEEKLA
jgi:flagellar biosynthesis chaperone FliJ